jgi:molybdate transport repressor ModE-like protein
MNKEVADMENPEEMQGTLMFKLRIILGTAWDSGEEETFFGPGVYQLMREIEKYGTILTAARGMKMAYSKSWKIIRNMERCLGFQVLERHAGRGCGSKLTPKGEAFLAAYNDFVRELNEVGRESFQKHFREFLDT